MRAQIDTDNRHDPAPMTNLQAVALVAASIHIPLALTVWSMLVRRWKRLPLLLWTGGSLAMGGGATLYAAQGVVPDWASSQVAGALLSAAPALRIAALRLDLARSPRAGLLAALCALDFGLFLYSLDALAETPRVLLGFCSMTLWALAFAWHAAWVGRELRSRSGRVLAAVEGLFALALGLHVVAMAAGWTSTRNFADDWDFVLLVVTGLMAALYGNLGYLGLVLDRTNQRARLARDDQLAEQVRRELAERHAADLQALLGQREQLLQLLAHEVRQPLHNAGIALQSAAGLLADGASTPPGAEVPASVRTQTRDRLQRAQGVLARVQSVLDNTLAAARLLSRQEQPLRVDTELDFLIRLALGDLVGAQRDRVVMRWLTPFRSAEVEPGLVRLALRNLLSNAFNHGGPQVQVTLEVADQDDPPALVLRVVDNGPGAPPPMLAAAAGATDTQLISGLAIVRGVMAAHGGELRLSAATDGPPPVGLAAELVFPQPA